METKESPEDAPTSLGFAAGEKMFGRFRLVRVIGRGGMGVVWLARDETLECDVALKVLPDAVRWDPSALVALRRETKRSRDLTHPHIVRVHDIHEDAGGAAIVMEYLPGGSLHYLRGSRTPPVLACAEIATWLPGLCAALDHAHAQGVVHRDLKPSNLLVAVDGAVKITDFGIAQPLLETSLRVSQWMPSGTLAYMSPQQQFGEQADKADDIYALGATLYDLLTGKPPFYTGNLAAQIERRLPDSLAERRRQLGVVGQAIPRAWEETIAACLAKQIEDRPASAASVASLLIDAPSSGLARSPAARAAVNGQKRMAMAKRPVVIGAMAVVFGVATWLPWSGETPKPKHPGAPFASDDTRALAAWNLDGDGLESSGRGWHLREFRTVPVPDRHGRIDRALTFNGSAGLDLAAPPELRWARDQPFSVALWVRPEGEGGANGSLITLRSEQVGEATWSLLLTGSRPIFAVRSAHVDDGDEVIGEVTLSSGAWCHLAGVQTGSELKIYVNGRQAGRVTCRPGTQGSTPTAANLLLGYGNKLDARKFVGALDEVRLWRRALDEAEIAALASAPPPPRFTLTQGTYAETVDLGAAIQREYGPMARLADWREIQRVHGDDARAWLDETEILPNGESILVQAAGRRLADSARHYFITRFDGTKPDYYLAHEEIGGMTLALGSWYGLELRALASLAFTPPVTMRLNSVGGVEHRFRPGQAPQVGAVRWWQDIQPPAASAAVEAFLTMRDGRRLRVHCAVEPGGELTVSLGDSPQPQRIRRLGVSYGRTEFTLAWREGRLDWRATSVESGVPLFREQLPLADFSPEEVAGLTVPSVDAAELTVEE